jgi:ligand-binding sensor domain-containing protein
LENRSLTDVAAANGHVWFAGQTGLVHYDAEKDLAEAVDGVSDYLEALAVDPSGTVIWFGSADGRVGRYTLDTGQVEWFKPSGDPVAALEMGPDGLPWVGSQNGIVLRPKVAGEWESLGAFQTASGSPTLKALALNPDNPGLLWVAEAFSVHRWHGEWDSYDQSRTGDKLVVPVNAVVVDGYGRAWFGHSQGITVQTEEQRDLSFVRCDAPGGGDALGVVLDLATSDAGQVLWIVTRGRLVRVDISDRDLPESCAGWATSDWGEYLTFWENEFGEAYPDYRLSVETGPQGSTVWLIRRDTGEVRRLNID